MTHQKARREARVFECLNLTMEVIMQMLSAQVYWADVQAAFPDKTEMECKDFLNVHAVCIEETMIEAGLQEVAALGAVL